MAFGEKSVLSGVPTGAESSGGGVPKLLEGTKLAFVKALRLMFASSLTNANLRYSEDASQTKIKIYSAHPLRMEFFPCIVVSVGGGDISFKYLQDDLTYTGPNNTDHYYAGQITFTVSLTILAQSTLDRERIIDHLIFYLRHVYVGAIRGFGIVHGRDMRLGSENISEVENKPLYEQSMDLPCYLEYKAKVDQTLVETLRAIGTTVTFTTGEEVPE